MTEYDGTVLPRLVDCHTHLVADATVAVTAAVDRCHIESNSALGQ